jgi:hypothetical protein
MVSIRVSAAPHPSFTGTWKMDTSQSDFGMLPKVSSITDRITEQGSEIVINRTREGRDVEIHIPLDGSQKDNDIMGNPMKTDAHWDGDVLTVNFVGTRNGKPISYKERWTLAPDGKTYQISRHLTSPRGETDQTLLMVKQ